MSLPYSKENIPFAQKLRREMTPQERKLWYCFLKKYSPRFQRQKVIGAYIVDFYCDAVNLAIEIDGSQHYEPEEVQLDERRTQNLNHTGVEVLRFSNRDVNLNFQNVCDMIDKTIRQKMENDYDERCHAEVTPKINGKHD